MEKNNRNNRSQSPENFKLARTARTIGSEFGSLVSSVSDNVPHVNAGRHSAARQTRRLSETPKKQKPSTDRAESWFQPSTRSNKAQKSPRTLSPLKSPIKPIPGARLAPDIPILDNTSMLGSTQLHGCQGDFCNFDLNSLEKEAVNSDNVPGSLKSNGKMNEFRMKLMSAGTRDSFIDKSSSLSKLVKEKSQWMHEEETEPINPTPPLSQGEELRQITLKSVIQARQELPLVKLELERHRKGEEGPYLREESYADLEIAGNLPSHYYQQVPCCQNCYKVYTIVDKARAKAVKQVNARKDKKKSKALSRTYDDESTVHSAADPAQKRLAQDLTNFQVQQLKHLNKSRKERKPYGKEQKPVSTEYDQQAMSNLEEALKAVNGLTKLDVAEIRTMVKPPAAVEVVMEAVMIILTGRVMTFQDTHRLLGGGEAFLLMINQFDLKDLTDKRLEMIEPYVSNPVFRPENVQPISLCAAKFCSWVHGIVHAAKFQRGITHERIDIIKAPKFSALLDEADRSVASSHFLKPLKRTAVPVPHRQVSHPSNNTPSFEGREGELTFVQKLERIKATRLQQQQQQKANATNSISRESPRQSQFSPSKGKKSRRVDPLEKRLPASIASSMTSGSAQLLSRSVNSLDPGPKPAFPARHNLSHGGMLEDESATDGLNDSSLSAGYNEDEGMEFNPSASMESSNSTLKTGQLGGRGKSKRQTKRESKALQAMQQRNTNRLAANSVAESRVGLVGNVKEFRAADGITKMPYVVLGKHSFDVTKCSFVVVHDFFDTYDNTAIMFKPIVQRHDGCQVMCFNYPGQAHTVWPRPSVAEKERGAKEPIMNNDWIADRLNELLRKAEAAGDILLSAPFHILGIGNGSAIAAAFAQRWGHDPLYANSLRSLVSINGFLYPDAQLSSILHTAYQVFESTPHSRPDIPVSYWCRYVFSDDYLNRVNPNLALNIYTAVSNPITNEGRSKIAKGCLQHRDLRGMLAPDAASARFTRKEGASNFVPIQIPVILLQSTEDTLVNASNVDSFLVGRTAKHLWSHMLNNTSEQAVGFSQEKNSLWVGKMSSGPEDYYKYSTLGKMGIKMILDSLRNPRGAFSMWSRTGHVVQQEHKAAVMDLLDILACPTDEYVGLAAMDKVVDTTQSLLTMTEGSLASEEDISHTESKFTTPQVDIVFKLEPPKTADTTGLKTSGERSQERSTSPEPSETFNDEVSALTKSLVLELGSNTELEDQSLETMERIGEEGSPQSEDGDSWIRHSPSKDVLTYVEHLNNQLSQTAEVRLGEVYPEAEMITEENELLGGDNAPTVEEQEQDIEVSVSGRQSPSEDVLSLVNQLNDQLSRSHEVRLGDGEPELAPEPDQDAEKSLSPAESHHSIEPHPVNLQELYAMERPNLPPTTVISAPSWEEAKTVGDKELVLAIKDGSEHIYESSHSQKKQNVWSSVIPDSNDALQLEAELRQKQKEYLELEAKLKKAREEADLKRLEDLEGAQAERRKEFELQDQELLKEWKSDLEKRQKERDFTEKQRRLSIKQMEERLIASGALPPLSAVDSFASLESEVKPEPVREMAPLHYEDPLELPPAVREGRDIISKLDQMAIDEEQARKRGMMSQEQYEKMKRELAERQMARDQMLRQMTLEEQQELFETCAIAIQRLGRGFNGRKRFKKLDDIRQLNRLKMKQAVKIQSVIRGHLGRKRYEYLRNIFLDNIKSSFSAQQVQRIYRGYAGRRYFRRLKRWVNAIKIERVFRGMLGRRAAQKERDRLALLRHKQFCAAKIQSVWRMKVGQEEFKNLRIHVLAATEIQRCFRGYLGRKKMARQRLWESTTPGPERIKLGLQFIEESKQAFERQQEEIDALHRAQERAEARVSHIHAELTDSEQELLVLEKELQEIDQIERDLTQLTHERAMLTEGIVDAAGLPRLAGKGHQDIVMGKASTHENDPVLDRRRRAEAYAMEMTIQAKRAEREKKRQELEIEFAAVFQEVEKKKKALERLELSLADMEATRERKDREFQRLQKNLMQLLLEQKQELDDLREKGIELETATATTAAAAVATAQKAKEHEKRSTAMFSQTEELMKFQFMSMSLSYFSSLNMLKSLKEMNADTTSAAISMSADASATAAAAAASANLPNLKKLDIGAKDIVEASVMKKKRELQISEKAEKEYHEAVGHPLPDNVRTWTVTDVSRWLDSMFLSQYVPAFVEGSVDGPFLMELREEDLVQVLGIKHKLHVRKILVSREKLKPLTLQEMRLKEIVEIEEQADDFRAQLGVPTLDTVFSQARNGRIKRVEESLNMGFPIDAEDEKGNTLLLVAAQNSNKRLCEMLLVRGAQINHQNAQGNTALHYALTFDAEGQLGEYLIEHGADDTVENIDGHSPYDGAVA